MSVRRIPKNHLFVTGVCAARKSIDEAAFEHLLERENITLLDFDPSVRDFEVQPVRIEWLDEKGKTHHYTPDCLVHFVDEHRKPELVEVKSRAMFWKEWKEERNKFRAAVHYAVVHGWKFVIKTEKEIRTGYLDSASFLTPFVRWGPVSAQDENALLAAIKKAETSTPKQLLASVASAASDQLRLLPTLWYLIGTFQIGADLATCPQFDSNIWKTQ